LGVAYDVTSLIIGGGTGSGQRVAIFELAPYIPGDFSAFRANYSLPASTVNNHSIDGATVTCAAGNTSCDVLGVGEADLDLEVVSALAPSATQDVYTGPNTGQGILDTYQAIATDNTAKEITTSWGLCEPNASPSFLQAQDAIFAQMASQGQTIYAASGDTGADDCRVNTGSATVDSPASDPYVVGVGGTTLTLNAGPSYGSEVTWNDSVTHSRAIGTGGGISTFFSRPSWQQGANMPPSPPQMRLVPDVSADADPFTGYSVYCTSLPDCGQVGWTVFGGTSAAAPLWAAITADINRYQHVSGKPEVGWFNYALYQLLGNSQIYAPFHDVTSGNNTVDTVGGFSAGPCFDETTGAGTPDAWHIAQDVAMGVQTGGFGPCPLPASSATNLIQNGGFEAVSVAPWQTFSQGRHPVVTVIAPHSGSNAFMACGYPSCDDRVSQTITVPNAVSSATLQFFVASNSSVVRANPGLACLDHFTVTLATQDGTVFDTVLATCGTDSFGYAVSVTNVTTALQSHLNQPIVIMFRGVAAGVVSGVPGDVRVSSIWFVDDVSLIVS
jgi:kumamolisin